MLRAAVLAVCALLVTPRVADACANEVQWTTNDDIRVVRQAEHYFEAGQYGRALKAVKRLYPSDKRVQARVQDLRAIIQIRVHAKADDLATSVAHLEARDAAAESKDVKYRAWLAEAYVASGRSDDARAILTDLHARDLMPDAYGYLALAKLSTGADRLAMWKACRTRAKDKAMCELPTVVSARQAPRS